MTKKIFILIAMTGFSILFQSLVYAQVLPIFGPTTYTREKGKPEKFTETFQTCAISGSYKLIVENGVYAEVEDESKKSKEIEKKKEKKTRVSAGEIKINGKEVVREEDFNKRIAKIEKTVSLPQGENQIEVEVEGEPGASIAITIIGPAATSVISPQGGIVSLDGCASVIFPPGAFTSSQNVTVSATASPETKNDYINDTPGAPRLPYEVRINFGMTAPVARIDVVLSVPDSFISAIPQNFELEVFVDMTYSTGNELLGGLRGMPFIYDLSTKSVRVTLWSFTNLFTIDGTYEAVIIIGSAPK